MFMRVKLFKLAGMMLLGILSPFLLLAQDLISGKVISTLDQSPISSVSVLIKGGSKGTMTNVDGLFSIRAAKVQCWFSQVLVLNLKKLS
jgi:hypothetical protein